MHEPCKHIKNLRVGDSAIYIIGDKLSVVYITGMGIEGSGQQYFIANIVRAGRYRISYIGFETEMFFETRRDFNMSDLMENWPYYNTSYNNLNIGWRP